MPSVFAYESTVMLVLHLALLAVKIFAFVTSLMYSDEAYRAAGKARKAPWAIGLAAAVLIQVIGSPINIINIALTVAALVFIVDVRPALAGLRRR